MLHRKCGITKNRKCTVKLVDKIVNTTYYNRQFICYIMYIFNIENVKSKIYNQDPIITMGEYVIYKYRLGYYDEYMTQACYQYLLYYYYSKQIGKVHKRKYKHYIKEIMIKCFKKYIIYNGPVKFINKILYEDLFMSTMHKQRFRSYNRYAKYKKLMKHNYHNTYKSIMNDKMIAIVYPNIYNDIKDFCNNKILENKKEIDKYLDMIYKYKHKNNLSSIVDSYINNPPRGTIERNAFRTSDLDTEFKKLFTKIRKIIDKTRFWNITMNGFCDILQI